MRFVQLVDRRLGGRLDRLLLVNDQHHVLHQIVGTFKKTEAKFPVIGAPPFAQTSFRQLLSNRLVAKWQRRETW